MKDYTILSDAQLTELLGQSDDAAFTEILKRYSPLLINFAYRKLADLASAEDLVHDVWTVLWMKRQKNQFNYGLQNFLFATLNNLILMQFRRAKIVDRFKEYFMNVNLGSNATTDHLIRHKELSEIIKQEIDALPPKMKAIFELSRRANLSRKEIAQQLDIPEGNVKINIERALKILKSRLACITILFFRSLI